MSRVLRRKRHSSATRPDALDTRLVRAVADRRAVGHSAARSGGAAARPGNRGERLVQSPAHDPSLVQLRVAPHTQFQCPKHKSRYRPEGTFIEGRATRGLDRFAIKLEGSQQLVNLDALYREDKNAAEWAAAFVPLSEK